MIDEQTMRYTIPFSNLSLSSSGPLWEVGTYPASSTTLAPQAHMNPIDPEIGDAHILKSFILYRAVQDPEIFDQTSDVFSVLGKRTVKVLFSKAKPLKLKDEKVEKDAPVSILVVPCFVDRQTFYAFLAHYADCRTNVGIQTEAEHMEYIEKLMEDDRLPVEAFNHLKESFLHPGPDPQDHPGLA